MRVAVIGTGNIGGTLGRAWERAGHEVAYGSRSKPVAEAVEGADVVVLALPGDATEGVLAQLGPMLDGLVVVDATNRLDGGEMNNRAAVLGAAPAARYVRAFNSLGWENFADPPEGADLFYAADAGAEQPAAELIEAVGLRPVLVGDASVLSTVDAVASLWFAMVRQTGERRLAFSVVR